MQKNIQHSFNRVLENVYIDNEPCGRISSVNFEIFGEENSYTVLFEFDMLQTAIEEIEFTQEIVSADEITFEFNYNPNITLGVPFENIEAVFRSRFDSGMDIISVWGRKKIDTRDELRKLFNK